ncbi:helix-turn-helix domain-containing protein [Domibacillus indicus]|uniref:helix-turn-helix domain-containing protein n=1 Tax=Domibacillus indicus TaxID=1437523 RepID=UPI00203D8824|nr:helix-turn-helix domain-containing protein [Domibacillus indicus]MCM3790007.1 helix-turn-helix domain-containing protein [Domibacillus indicus]
MGTRISYQSEVKMKAVKMRLAGVPVKEVLKELNIRNKTQLKTWMKLYKAGELHRFKQPSQWASSIPSEKGLNMKVKRRS